MGKYGEELSEVVWCQLVISLRYESSSRVVTCSAVKSSILYWLVVTPLKNMSESQLGSHNPFMFQTTKKS